jgi:NADPH:quinone reductase-like Zn-dependent oxidoreductase/acyl carrier protein
VALEHPELRCLRVDLDPAAPAAEAQELAAEIVAAGREDQVAFRGGTRHVPRLVPLGSVAAGSLPPMGQPFRLEVPTRGVLENLAFRPIPRPRPGPGEVLLRVRATGLNFRDVLNVLGMYPGAPGPLGGECAGFVEEVGPGVEGLAAGAEVVALAPASFASFALTRAEFVVPRPAGLSPAQAAAVPVVFLTAHHALNHLAHLCPGERVLVHAASGGVGLAALQLARRAGAEVYATAGSPAKRAYLETLGIRDVFNSRSLDFAEGVRAATGGEGVDVVLNSLRGEFIPRSLELLRPGGCFLEIGKTDLWNPERVARVNPHATYFPIALDRMMAEEPALVGRLLREVFDDFRAGTLQPPPIQTFSIRDAVPAFRHLAQARHIGKVVLTQDEVGGAGPAVRPDGSYLVTGGLGALGLRVARRLAERGARYLVLAGRGEPSAEARAAVAEMERGGVRVVVARADVARPADVSRLVAEAAALAPLRGVVHAAGVLDDGALVRQSWSRFRAVLAPKLAGARNLDRLSRGQPLDFFVCFSSAAALVGSPGQGNYAAANAALDALVHRRRSEGLSALSVNWGPWAGGGMAEGWGGRGITPLTPDTALDTLESLLGLGVAQAAVLDIDWTRFRESFPAGAGPAWLGGPGPRTRRQPADAGAFLRRLQAAEATERRDLVLAHLQGLACQALGRDPSRPPDPRRPLHDLGLDSLMAVELRNGLNQALGRNFPATLLFEHPTLEALAGFLVAELFLDPAATASAASADQHHQGR